jgi:rfaE bifunctional protein nucleotidyltransferase chain/domain
MKYPISKIMTSVQVRVFRGRHQAEGKRLAFTNGCFDILHRGHVTYLQFARNQADALCVGLNSDASVKRNKGENRPINSEEDRAFVLASLDAVDCVVIFDENEPRDLIAKILPQEVLNVYGPKN